MKRTEMVQRIRNLIPSYRLLELTPNNESILSEPRQRSWDVVFLANYHDWRSAYAAIEDALLVLDQYGFVVVHNTKPSNAVVGASSREYGAIDPQVKRMNKGAWTGDVWKAIVALRAWHTDLVVVTVDSGWGFSFVTRGTPESSLRMTADSIDCLTFAELEGNESTLLNLRPETWVADFLSQYSAHASETGFGEFYVEDRDSFSRLEGRNYALADPPCETYVDRGIVLPVKSLAGVHAYGGGVCDAGGGFVDGHARSLKRRDARGNVSYAYDVAPDDLTYVDETVVYAGYVYKKYGHMITECLSRMWWFLKNRRADVKFVFVSADGAFAFKEFFQMLGIPEDNLILVTRPTRFKAVIVPNQLTFLVEGIFHPEVINVYDAIRDSVSPSPYEKVYLTRREFEPRDIVGEDYFAQYFESQGYLVISPERLTIPEQVSLMAGVKDLVCISGSLQHQILFCQDDTRVTILNKTTEPLQAEFWIAQLRSAVSTYVDVSANFLPANEYRSGYLFLPTQYWREYLQSRRQKSPSVDFDASALVSEYVKLWSNLMLGKTPAELARLKRYTLADLTIGIQKYLVGREVERKVEQRLRTAYSHPTPT